MPDKKEIISLLDEIADMLEYKGENPFKIKAYRNGANSIRKIDNLEELIEKKSLNNVNGVGKSIQSIIYEFYNENKSSLYEELKKEVPDGIEQLLKIRGLSPSKIRILYTELGVKSFTDLEQACKENKLVILKGFGQKIQEKILTEIENFKIHSKFVLLNTGELFAKEITDKLKKFSSVTEVEISGELRRGSEIISAINVVILVSGKKKFEKELKNIFNTEFQGNKALINEYFEIPVTLHLTLNKEEFIKEIFITTGSDLFIKNLNKSIDKIKADSEEKIFNEIHAPYVIPEMREGEYFRADKKLRENSDISLDKFKGLLHFHSTYSDGRSSLKDMIRSAEERGFEYAAVCDHSKSAYYARGLKEETIYQQKQELTALASEYKLHLFHGIESDILQNGDLDYSKDFFHNFDFIVSSIHSRFNMDEKEMTIRMIKAIENPFTDLLAHPSGRMLLARAPYKFDVKKIIDACAANKVAVEINSNPRRLDIDWRWIYYGREKGVLFSINPDAHSTEEIDLLKYGIKMSRKAGLKTSEVINCFSLKEFKKFLRRRVKRDIK